MKRQGTTFDQLIQRIPADVLTVARGRTLALPIGEETVRVTLSPKAIDVRVSLRTRDPSEAKARQAVATAYLERVWASLRAQPASLTNRQVVALSGILYRDLVSQLEDEPGAAGFWQEVARAHQRASESGNLEAWLGSTIDGLLLAQGLCIDGASRSRLLEASAKALIDAAGRLGRNAEGDYGPDATATRFPVWTGNPAEAKAKPAAGKDAISVSDLFCKLAKERGYSPKTVSEWTRALNRLTEHAGTTDARTVTADHIIAWTDELVAQGLGPVSVCRRLYVAGFSGEEKRADVE